MLKISVLISTRNRSTHLETCLDSLKKQSHMPDEVIIVDNNSSDNTKALCNAYKKFFQLKYKMCRQIGLPFARNLSIRSASHNILAFIDDDCIADNHWIESIVDHFIGHNKSVGVIGKTKNTQPANIYSVTEDMYYHRWLLRSVHNPKKKTLIKSGALIDFKNCAFRDIFVKNFSFSAHAPYGDVGDEDVEMGTRLYQSNKNIYFDPDIKVGHEYSSSLKRLLIRNFWNGYSNKVLLIKTGINLSPPLIHKTNKTWTAAATKSVRTLDNSSRKLCLLVLLLFYPISSKIGGVFAWLSNAAHINIQLPSR